MTADTITMDVTGAQFTITNRRESRHFNTLAVVDVVDAEGVRVAEASVTYQGEVQIQRFRYATALDDIDFWTEFRAKVGAAVIAGAAYRQNLPPT